MTKIELASLKQLALFACVVEQGNFSKAAIYLGVSRSRISEQVASLEKTLDTRLFQRTTRKLTLTEDGSRIYPHAANIVKEQNLIHDFLNQDRLSGRIRVTATLGFAEKWLLPALNQFSILYPEVLFDVIISDKSLDLVAEQIDLAVRVGPLNDASFIARPLFEDRLALMASPEYIDRYGMPKTIDELKEHRWLLIPQLNPGKRVTLKQQKETVHFVPKLVHMSDSPDLRQSMTEQGMGIGIILPVMIPPEKAASFAHVMPGWNAGSLQFSLIYPSRLQLPLRVKVLIDYLCRQKVAQ